MPVMESYPEMSAAKAVELEKVGGSVWEDFFGYNWEINISKRMWVSMLAKRLGSERDLTTLAPMWETVQHYLPQYTALRFRD